MGNCSTSQIGRLHFPLIKITSAMSIQLAQRKVYQRAGSTIIGSFEFLRPYKHFYLFKQSYVHTQ